MSSNFALVENPGGMPMAVLKHPRASASVNVHLQGAHVDGWVTGSGAKPLYTSATTAYKEGKAIRGGVPVCWPQFSDLGPCSASHGYARSSMWEPVGSKDDADRNAVSITLRLTKVGSAPSPFDACEVEYTVTLVGDSNLELALSVTNPSSAAIEFTTALHSYFSVSDISAVRIDGVLDECPYADNTEQRAMKPAAPIRTIEGEVDRIYHGSKGNAVRVTDSATGATTTITADGLDDTVLWNPWIEKAAKLADMPDDGYKSFVCVESAAVNTKATAAPGSTWTGTQRIAFAAAGSSSSKM
jgi:glucose-6-phosphate 1-epimerase